MRLGLFPLRSVLLPGAALRLHIFEERYKQMIGACIESGDPFGVLLDRNANEVGDALDPVDVGTTAHIGEVHRLPQGRLFIVTRGGKRFKVDRVLSKKPFWSAEVTYLGEPVGGAAATSLVADAGDRFTNYLQALLALFGRELESVQLPEDATSASYLIADALQVDVAIKQQLLEAATAIDRLQVELVVLEKETARLHALAERSSASSADRAEASAPAPFGVRISLN